MADHTTAKVLPGYWASKLVDEALKARGIDGDSLAWGLNTHVHRAKAWEASDLNDRGAVAQTSYLLSVYGESVVRTMLGLPEVE